MPGSWPEFHGDTDINATFYTTKTRLGICQKVYTSSVFFRLKFYPKEHYLQKCLTFRKQQKNMSIQLNVHTGIFTVGKFS